LSHFFARIEQVGKQQIRSWIQNSPDTLILPPPDLANAWSIGPESNSPDDDDDDDTAA
jgi:hypothetical protein